MSDSDDFGSNRFHFCARAARFIAVAEGRLSDGTYVQCLRYDLYESGAFRAFDATNDCRGHVQTTGQQAIVPSCRHARS
jgi:hypothetical protein